jgi:hypothetical protein
VRVDTFVPCAKVRAVMHLPEVLVSHAELVPLGSNECGERRGPRKVHAWLPSKEL